MLLGMSSVSFLAAYFLCLALVVYCCFCADPDAAGWQGELAHALTVALPATLESLGRKIAGDTVVNGIKRVFHWVVYERNPLLQLLYLSLILGAYTTAVLKVYPQIPNAYLSANHKVFAFVGVVVCLASFVQACRVPPGRVTEGNQLLFASKHEYDELLYRRDVLCTTCGTLKVARSKHCRMMGYCIPKYDHYCVWLAQTVGMLNYRYFYSFLIIHMAFFWYGSYIVGMTLLAFVEKNDLWNSQFYVAGSMEAIDTTWHVVAQYLLYRQLYVLAVFALAVVMAVAITCFTGYHTFLILSGKTTNEVFKWKEVKNVHSLLTRKYADYVRSGAADADDAAAAAGEVEEKKGGGAGSDGGGDGDGSGDDGEDEEDDGPQTLDNLVVKKDPGPFPRNQYRVGIFRSFYDVFFPLRPEEWAFYEEDMDAEEERWRKEEAHGGEEGEEEQENAEGKQGQTAKNGGLGGDESRAKDGEVVVDAGAEDEHGDGSNQNLEAAPAPGGQGVRRRKNARRKKNKK